MPGFRQKIAQTTSSGWNSCPHFQENLNGPLSAQFASLLQEKDPSLFADGLIVLGRNLEASGQNQKAEEIYRWLITESRKVGGNEGQAKTAQECLNAIQGKGSLASRTEFLLDHFVKEAIDPRMMIPMLGATVVGPFGKALALGRGSKMLAGGLGFAAEGLTFAALGRLCGNDFEQAFGADLARSYIGLGALKLSGILGRKAAQQLNAHSPIVQAVLPQVAMFHGLLLAHQVEIKLGLRPDASGGLVFLDTLSALINLQVGARLGHAALGPGFQRWQQDLERYGQHGPAHTAPDWGLNLANRAEFSIAGSVSRRPGGIPDRYVNSILMMASDPAGESPPSSGGGGKSTNALAETMQLLADIQKKKAVDNIKFSDLSSKIPLLSPKDLLSVVRTIPWNLPDSNSRIQLVGLFGEIIPRLDARHRRSWTMKLQTHLGDSTWQVVSAASKALVTSATSLSREDLHFLAQKIDQRFANPRDPLRVEAAHAHVGLLPLLDKAPRQALLKHVQARLSDPSEAVRSRALAIVELIAPGLERDESLEWAIKVVDGGNELGPLENILPQWEPAELRALASRAELQLASANFQFRQSAVDALRLIVPHLQGSFALELVKKMEDQFGVGDSKLDRDVIFALSTLIQSLEPEDRQGRVAKIIEALNSEVEDTFRSANIAISMLTSHGMGGEPLAGVNFLELALTLESKAREKMDVGMTLLAVIPNLDESSLITFALKLLERLSPGNDANYLKTYFEGLFDARNGIAARLNPEDRIRVALELERRSHHVDKEIRKNALEVLKTFLPHLRPSDLKDIALQIAAASDELGLPTLRALIHSMGSKDLLVVAVKYVKRLKRSPRQVSKALSEIIPALEAGERVKLLAEMMSSVGVRGTPLPLLYTLVKQVSVEMMAALPAKRAEPDFRLIADYHRTRLPFEPYFWNAYLNDASPSAYLQEITLQLDEYRRGKQLTIGDERELRLAHAALGSPEGLPFEKFAREVKVESAPFLQRPFETAVTLLDPVHHKIDKGKIFQALEPVMAINRAEGLKKELAELIDREPGALKHFRKVLEKLFPPMPAGETQSSKELIQGIEGLLPQVWERRNSPPVQSLLSLFILFLGWQQSGADSLRSKMEKVQDPSVSSEVLGMGLRATEEFYRDTLGHVVRQHRLDGEQIPFLKKQRRLLKAELDRLETIQGQAVRVEFLPSKSQADRFFGYVGEDCNKGQTNLIYRRDFQFYRMISDSQLVGLLYLQEAVLDGKAVLVMAIQPRSFWHGDSKGLLEAIEKNFSQIGSEEGFDYVLLSANDHQRSNRQDMLKAIADREFSRVEFKNHIQGTIFNGRHFLVMWKK